MESEAIIWIPLDKYLFSYSQYIRICVNNEYRHLCGKEREVNMLCFLKESTGSSDEDDISQIITVK